MKLNTSLNITPIDIEPIAESRDLRYITEVKTTRHQKAL